MITLIPENAIFIDDLAKLKPDELKHLEPLLNAMGIHLKWKFIGNPTYIKSATYKQNT